MGIQRAAMNLLEYRIFVLRIRVKFLNQTAEALDLNNPERETDLLSTVFSSLLIEHLASGGKILLNSKEIFE